MPSSFPAAMNLISFASWSARPDSMTTAPRPTDPARMNSTFQSSALAAERGVSTPVSTIRSAPATEVNSTGARPNEAATMTATRMASASQVLPGCGARLAASCQSATTSLSWIAWTSSAVT